MALRYEEDLAGALIGRGSHLAVFGLPCYIAESLLRLGRVAQLGERGVRNAEVEGSNPFASTKIPYSLLVIV